MSEEKITKTDLIIEGVEATTRQAATIGKLSHKLAAAEDRIKELEAELKAYREGIPIEEANGEMYFYKDTYNQPWALVKYGHGYMGTHILTGEITPMYPQGRLYPLPPNNKGGE